MPYKRRMGEVRPKKKTPSHREPTRHDVRLEIGDVVFLTGGRYGGWRGHGVVVAIEHYKGGDAKVIDWRGDFHGIPKTLPDPMFEDHPPAILIGHDDEWMRFELGVMRRRMTIARPHSNIGHQKEKKAKEERLRKREAGEIVGVTEEDCRICSYHNRFGCTLGYDRTSCDHFIRRSTQEGPQ